VSDTGLGPLAARIPEVLRGSTAYHVPVPPNVIAKLDANELPYALPADLRAQLAGELATLALERYPDPTAKRLRAAISRQLGVAGERIVFGNGSDELIAMLCAAFPGPILVPTPTFVYYKIAAVNRGLPLVEVPLGPRFELDEAAMLDSVAVHQPSVVFLALPNNPTGGLWRMSFATELAALHRDVVVVSDEAYVAYSGATNLPVLDEHPNLVVMRTLSKLGMAGLRVGYVIASRSLATVLEKVRPPYNLSTLDQRAAEFLLDHASDWCMARAAEVVVERERLAIQLAERGFDVIPSQANLLLVRFADAAATWQQLFDRGISVRKFGPGPLVDHLRITVGTPEENAAFLAALEPNL
jgi:histidinol-phosphate aminotransferase